jgi:hypothetical protein
MWRQIETIYGLDGVAIEERKERQATASKNLAPWFVHDQVTRSDEYGLVEINGRIDPLSAL